MWAYCRHYYGGSFKKKAILFLTRVHFLLDPTFCRKITTSQKVIGLFLLSLFIYIYIQPIQTYSENICEVKYSILILMHFLANCIHLHVHNEMPIFTCFKFQLKTSDLQAPVSIWLADGVPLHTSIIDCWNFVVIPGNMSRAQSVHPVSARAHNCSKQVGRCSPRLTRAPMRNPWTKEGI